MLVGSLHRGFRLHVVGWIDDYHSRDGPHKSDVLVALMGGTVLTHRDTRVGSSDLYVQFGIADGVADLLKGAACRKHGKGAGKGDLACGGDPSRHAHHIGLSDTAVNMALRKSLLEGACLGGVRQVSVQDNYILVFLS